MEDNNYLRDPTTPMVLIGFPLHSVSNCHFENENKISKLIVILSQFSSELKYLPVCH